MFLAARLRGRMHKALRGERSPGSAVRDLGCSIENFRLYIESKFYDGMSWDNQGAWHLDHIVPLSSFNLTDRAQFLLAAHYTNYQPLWASENHRKSSKPFLL